MLIRRRHDERAGAAQFLVQKADGVILPVVRTKRIRADELGEAIRLVRFRRAERSHLMQYDRRTRCRDLMRCFRPCEARPNHMNGR